MKRPTVLALAISIALGCGWHAMADATTDRLVDELAGRTEWRQRAEAEMKADYGKAVQYLIAEQLVSPDVGLQGKGFHSLERMCFEACRPGREPSRATLCSVMAAALKPQTPAHARVWILRILENTGREESVEGIAGCLGDADAQVRQRARCALQNNPSPAAGDTLVAALAKTIGADRVGIINALGYRKQVSAVPALSALLGDSDRTVASAAAAALGQIGTVEAADALGKVAQGLPPNAQALDAWLKCAASLAGRGETIRATAIHKAAMGTALPLPVRAAALRGLVLTGGNDAAVAAIAAGLEDKEEYVQTVAASLVGTIPAQVGTRLISEKKSSVKPAIVAIMIRAMAERKEPVGAPLLLELARDGDAAVQLAALDGLGDCGDGSVVTVLAGIAGTLQGPPQQAARASLERMTAANVDQAMLAALPGAEAKVRQEYCRALGVRRAVRAMPVLMDLAGKDADPSVRAEAIRAVGLLGGVKEMEPLLAMLISPKSDVEAKAAEDAVSGMISRVRDPDQRAEPLLAVVDKAGKARASILQLLGRTGGPKAVAVLRAAAQDPAKEIQTAAIRAMSEWPNDGLAEDLHAIALATRDQTQQVLAIRGFNRLMSLQNNRRPADVVRLHGELLPVARPEERKALLSGLSNISTIESFRLVAGQLDAPGTQNEAASACVKIGRDIVGRYPKEVGPVVRKILEFSKDERTRRLATEVLGRIKE